MGTILQSRVILIYAVLLVYIAAELEYFSPGHEDNWEDARSYCKKCFKDLVTVTPENSQSVAQLLSGHDYWIGLRKNSNSSDNSNVTWYRWANGEPLLFQNWYPGWPVFKSTPPKIDCCSCSCTCPAMAIRSSELSTLDTEELTDSTIVVTEQPTEFYTLDSEITTDFRTLYPENTTDFNNSDPENTTEFFTLNPENPTEFNHSDPENTTEFFTLKPENPTEFNHSDPENPTEFFTLNPENPTEFNNADLESTTEFYTMENTDTSKSHTSTAGRVASSASNTIDQLESSTTNTMDQTEPSISNTVDYAEFDTTDSENVNLTTLSDRSGKNVTNVTTTGSTSPTPTTSHSGLSYTTSSPFLEIEATCVRTPTPLVLETENYIEESCVAMLSSGPWIEKHCFEILPFICFEERFLGQLDVTDVTQTSGNLNWTQAPGDISHYRLEVKGDVNQTHNLTTFTYNLENLTPGTNYKVQVFPVKCERDLNPQNATFYTVPNKVINLNISSVTETSVTLLWEKPEGNLDFYRIQNESNTIQLLAGTLNKTTINDLLPGGLYTFRVTTLVKDKSKWSEESQVTTNTKPGKVSNLNVADNTEKSVVLNWAVPAGFFTGFRVTANSSNFALNETVEKNRNSFQVNDLPCGSKVTLSVTTLAKYQTELNYVALAEEADTVTIDTFTAPGEISNLRMSSTESTITATWDPAKGNEVSYIATLKLGSENTNITKTADTSVTFDGLKNSAEYFVDIVAISGEFKGPHKNGFIYTTPKNPTNARNVSSSTNSILFKWDAPANTATPTYLVKLTSDIWKRTIEDSTNATQYEFKNLTSGSKYVFSVRTKSGNDISTGISCDGTTVPDTIEIFLSVVCSTDTDLRCEEDNTKRQVIDELKKHFTKKVGDQVHWSMEN